MRAMVGAAGLAMLAVQLASWYPGLARAPLALLELGTSLAPDGSSLPSTTVAVQPLPGATPCQGVACAPVWAAARPAGGGAQAMVDSIRKVLGALKSRLGTIQAAERAHASSMARKVRLLRQKVGSLHRVERKIAFLQSDVRSALAAPGPPGSRGQRGAQGPSGAGGQRGAVGPAGPRGVAGVQGAQGPPGLAGAPGVGGIAGPAGPQGRPGREGNGGARGTAGAGGGAVARSPRDCGK